MVIIVLNTVKKNLWPTIGGKIKLEVIHILIKRNILLVKNTISHALRYHGRWIDSVWKSRSYADVLKENPINLYIF